MEFIKDSAYAAQYKITFRNFYDHNFFSKAESIVSSVMHSL
jgi:hypothetical protein